jgi:hypothetical protein
MRLGNRDKTIRPSSENAIEATHTVGPTGGMKCGTYDGDTSQTGRNTSPKHFVASTNSDNSVKPLPNEMIRKPIHDKIIVFMAKPMARRRKLSLDRFP